MRKVFIFLGFITIFSALFSGCSALKTKDNQVGETNLQVDDNSGASAEKKSEYPPIPSAVAQSEIKKIDDSTLKLEDKKGKVVLVNLWATWCGPCRGEMPHLTEMQEKYRDQGFEIIGLDVDAEPVEEIKDFAEEMKLNYQLGWAERELVGEFYRISKFDGIPQSFLIDRKGNLRGVFLGGGKKVIETMKETVEKVVNE